MAELTRREGLGLAPALGVSAPREIGPKLLSAPTEDCNSSPSLETYARFRRPAPVPRGRSPPQPPHLTPPPA